MHSQSIHGTHTAHSIWRRRVSSQTEQVIKGQNSLLPLAGLMNLAPHRPTALLGELPGAFQQHGSPAMRMLTQHCPSVTTWLMRRGSGLICGQDQKGHQFHRTSGDRKSALVPLTYSVEAMYPGASGPLAILVTGAAVSTARSGRVRRSSGAPCPGVALRA